MTRLSRGCHRCLRLRFRFGVIIHAIGASAHTRTIRTQTTPNVPEIFSLFSIERFWLGADCSSSSMHFFPRRQHPATPLDSYT